MLLHMPMSAALKRPGELKQSLSLHTLFLLLINLLINVEKTAHPRKGISGQYVVNLFAMYFFLIKAAFK